MVTTSTWLAFRSFNVCMICQYLAWIRTCLVNLSVVSILWLTTSGAASMMRCIFSLLPLKSGISVSKVVVGFNALTALMVLYQMMLPPSFNSSLSTEVMTACFTFIRLMASATRCGSSQSTSKGLPVATLQKPQLRVQILPSIMNVAVPSPQHSPIFGQLPLSQMVCSLWVSTRLLTWRYSSP